jgi:hypothetical protein
MKVTYILQVISTGEQILTETFDLDSEERLLSLAVWQRKNERKISNRKNRAQRFRDAIAANDTIGGWHNFDELAATLPQEELQLLSDAIFRGYDKWFNERAGSAWDGRND